MPDNSITPQSHKKPILERPENWEDMVNKHQQREQENLDRVLEQRNVRTLEELQAVAKEAIVSRLTRRSTKEFVPLKDRTVHVDPKSPDIAELKRALNKEIQEMANALLQQIPQRERESLKGRVTLPTAESKA